MATSNQGPSATDLVTMVSLRDAPFLVTASTESKDILESAADMITYSNGSVIFRQGEPAEYVLFIRSGAVRIYVEQPDGHRVELRTLHAGEIFGELSVVGGQACTANAQAATDVEAWLVDHNTFNAVYRSDPKVTIEIAKVMAPYVLADEGSVDVTVGELRERVAKTLVETSADGVSVTCPELARMTGALVSNVISVLEHFEAEGTVAIGSNGVEIIDLDGLKTLAQR